MKRRQRLLLVSLVASWCAACENRPPLYPHCAGVASPLTVAEGPTGLAAFPDVPSPVILRAWVDRLAAPEMKGRHSLADGGRTTAVLVAEKMSDLGLTAPWGESFCGGFEVQGETAYNVVARLGPAAGGAPRDVVLVGAHYDGQGLQPNGRPFPGADDNASGIAALVELARLATRREWAFDLLFTAFGAEEMDRGGSRAWLRAPPFSRLRWMVNFDMVGRGWPGRSPQAIGYLAGGIAPGNGTARLTEAGAAAAIEVRALTDRFAEAKLVSDSTTFGRVIPTLYLSTGLHEDHHQRTDTPDLVDVEQISRAVRLTFALLVRLDEEGLGEGPHFPGLDGSLSATGRESGRP